MDRSRTLAAFAGPLLGLIGLSMLINHDLAPTLAGQLSHDFGLIIVSGGLLLVAGLAILRAHNVWAGWPAIVTVLGWLALIGGAVRIVMPSQLAAWAPSLVRQPYLVTVAALVMLMLGAFLTFQGWRGSA